jgi:hypothetical protein
MSVVISQAYTGGVVNNTAITTNQIFPLPASMVTAAGPGNLVAATCIIPGSGKLNGRYFYINIGATFTAGASMNVTPILYSGSSLTPGSNTIIATGTAIATGGVLTADIDFTYEGNGSTASGFLQGVQSQLCNEVFVNPTATGVTKLTGINYTTNDPVLLVCFGLTFSVANAANTATLTQFVLEA